MDTFVSNDREWPRPIPLRNRPAPPAFPIERLPELLGKFASELATETQTPPDLAAMLSIGCVAACLGGKATVRVRKNWTEPLCLWTVVALPPGARKSPVLSRVTRPLFDFEKAVNPKIEQAAARAAAERSLLQRRLDKLERELVQGKGSKEEYLQLADEISRFKVPNPLQLMVNDCTPERLPRLLAEHGGRMAWISDEAGIFETIAGQYRGGVPNIDIFNKAHDGSSVRVARQGQPSVNLDNPALTMALAIQPSVLKDLKRTKAFRGRGLLGRFLFAIPTPMLGKRTISPPETDEGVEARYREAITSILQATHGSKELWQMDLTSDAHTLLNKTAALLEPRLATNLSQITDWASKLVGRLARVAAIFATIRHIEQTGQLPQRVEEEDVARATALADYLIAHALHAFDAMDGDSIIGQAEELLRYIRRRSTSEFSARDLFQSVKGRTGFDTMKPLWPVLNVLEEYGHIRKKTGTQQRGPGRPSMVYELHPDEFY
jgi:hypothetical protein